MELPWQQLCLLLLVVFLISAANPAAPPISPIEPVNKEENPPLVYELQHKYHPSTTPTSTIKTEPASPEMLTKRDTRRRATAIFPVAGNVYPDGLYYASMYIGEPPKLYFLEIDTGSELTWLRCNAPRYSPATGPNSLYRLDETKLVSPEDPLCVFLNNPLSSESVSVKKRCNYQIGYFDASSRGVLVKDTFNISLTDGSVIRTNLAFGCGYDQKGSLAISPSAADGVLGLINSKLSVVSQLQDQGLLRNVIGHCYNGQGGGYLFFGDDLIPSSGMTWIPMSHNPSPNYYSPGPANLILGNQLLMKDVVVVFDSGATYSYLASHPYQAFIAMVKKNILEKPLSETSDGPLNLCWKGTKPFETILDAKDYFNPLILEFKNGKNSKLQISPEGYLIITSQGNVCLGVLSGDEEGLDDLNLLGGISLQHHLIVYDNEKNKIGWFPSDCNRLPNTDGDDGYQEGYTRPYTDNMGILKEEPLECPPDALPQQSDVERCEALVSEQSKRCTSSEISSHDWWINKCGIL